MFPLILFSLVEEHKLHFERNVNQLEGVSFPPLSENFLSSPFFLYELNGLLIGNVTSVKSITTNH